MPTRNQSYLVISDAVGPSVLPGQHLCDKLCPRLYTKSLSLKWAEEGVEVEAAGKRGSEEKQVFFKLKQAIYSNNKVSAKQDSCHLYSSWIVQ